MIAGDLAQRVGELSVGCLCRASRRSWHGVDGDVVRQNLRLLRKAGEAASPDCLGTSSGSHATSICSAPGAPILFTAPGALYAKGKRRVKVVPSCAVLVTAMVPLWAWAMSWAMARPNP